MMTIEEYVREPLEGVLLTRATIKFAIEDYLRRSRIIRNVFIDGLTETNSLNSSDIDGIEEDYLIQITDI